MPPTATDARKNTAIESMALTPYFVGSRFGRVQRRSQPLLLAVITGAIPEARAADAGRAVMTDDVAVGVFTSHVVNEQVLGDDDIAFHAHHLSDVRNLA